MIYSIGCVCYPDSGRDVGSSPTRGAKLKAVNHNSDLWPFFTAHLTVTQSNHQFVTLSSRASLLAKVN